MTIVTELPLETHYAAAPPGPDENWRLRSVCANHSDINLWFPDGAAGHWLVRIEAAKRLCREVCPVLDQCRALLEQMEAAGTTVHGIWASTTEEDRDGEKLRARKAASRARYNAKRRAAA